MGHDEYFYKEHTERFEKEWKKKTMGRKGFVYIYDKNYSSIRANKYKIEEYYEGDYDYEHTEVYLYYNDIEIAQINLRFIREVV